MRSSFAVLALAATAAAQQVKVCTSPEVWEAQSREYNIALGETITASVAFDSVNKRIAHRETISDGIAPGRRFYETLYLYNERMMYRVESASRKCIKSRIPDNILWRPFGVPKNATFLQQEMIGVPGAQFLAHEYVIRAPEHPNGFYYRGVFTAIECAPVTEHIIRSEGLDISKSDIINYYNVVLGISNPAVFNIPPMCEEVSEEAMMNPPR